MLWDAALTGKQGRRRDYGDPAIQTCLTLKMLVGMALRQTTGFVGSLLELIGLDSPEADAEMVAMAVEALQGLGFDDFKIDMGQVEFCRGVLAASGLTGSTLQELQDALSRKDSSAVACILDANAVPDASRLEISALPRLFGGREVLDEACRVTCNSRSLAALENLRQVLAILDIHGVSDYLTFDLGETRGLDYHTGVTFEGFVSGLGEPVCGGGRYDNLTGRYGFPAPATGFTFNVLSLLQALQRRPELEASTTHDFLLFNRCDDRREVLEVARLLRAQGYTTARDIIRREYASSLAYARRMNIRCMLVVGDESGRSGCSAVRVRDGHTIPVSGEQLQQNGLMKLIEESQGDE